MADPTSEALSRVSFLPAQLYRIVSDQGQAPEYALFVPSSIFFSTSISLFTDSVFFAGPVLHSVPLVGSTASNTALRRLDALVESRVAGRAIVPDRELVSLE
jgi:hypothetical protein